MSLNVLIVDDSKVARSMIRKTLSLASLELGEVVEASNGQEGLLALEEHWIDLALVDINMPVMNGQEMIERVRENPAWANLPVIVVSTEGSQTRIDHLQQKGITFVHKPFSPETVCEIITQVTGAAYERQY